MRGFIYPINHGTGAVREVVLMQEDVTERKRVDDAIRLIAAGVSATTGKDFFQHLARSLAGLFGADFFHWADR